jgi:hypothetical protein
MKVSQLRQLIKEEISKALSKEYIKVKDIYYQLNDEKPKVGDWIMYPNGSVIVMNKIIYPDYLKGKLNVKKVVAASYPHTGIPTLDINKIPNSLKENTGNKYQVTFYDDFTETPVKQLFDSKEEAEQWADGLEYDYQDIVINDRGDDEWKTFYKFHNPEDKETYNGYEVKQI